MNNAVHFSVRREFPQQYAQTLLHSLHIGLTARDLQSLHMCILCNVQQKHNVHATRDAKANH